MKSVENEECGKCGVLKMWSVENTERDNWRNKSLQNGKLNNL